MDFAWSPSQSELYDRLLTEARELNVIAAGRGFEEFFDRQEWRACGRAGILGLTIPSEYGGGGHDFLTTAHALEAFGEGCEDMGLVFAAGAHLFACAMPILQHASPELKVRLLPPLCSGAWIGAHAMTEPEAGSDAFALKMRATRDGDDYVLRGTKSFVTNGPQADVVIVYAATEPSHGVLGISAFAVERDYSGFEADPHFEKMGLTSAPACVLHFRDSRVPATNLLGEEGQGGLMFSTSMQWERACLFAGYLGMLRRQLAQAIARAKERIQFGKKIGKYQAISHRIADMKLRIESASFLLYRACWLLDQGKDAALEASLAKLAISESSIQTGIDLIRIFGGAGFLTATGIERGLRDAIGGTIASGTSEIQREIIARELGL